MAISFACPNCNTALTAPDGFANKQAKCKACGAAVRIPLDDADQGATARPRSSADAPPEASAPSGARPPVPARRYPVFGFHYTHSNLARVLDIAARVVFVVAILVQVYTFWQVDWRTIPDIPFALAIPAMAVTVVPGAGLGLLGLCVLAMARIVEYLARIASR